MSPPRTKPFRKFTFSRSPTDRPTEQPAGSVASESPASRRQRTVPERMTRGPSSSSVRSTRMSAPTGGGAGVATNTEPPRGSKTLTQSWRSARRSAMRISAPRLREVEIRALALATAWSADRYRHRHRDWQRRDELLDLLHQRFQLARLAQ